MQGVVVGPRAGSGRLVERDEPGEDDAIAEGVDQALDLRHEPREARHGPGAVRFREDALHVDDDEERSHAWMIGGARAGGPRPIR